MQQATAHMSGLCRRLLFLVYCLAAGPRSCSCTPRSLTLLSNPSQSLTPAWARRGWATHALKLCELLICSASKHWGNWDNWITACPRGHWAAGSLSQSHRQRLDRFILLCLPPFLSWSLGNYKHYSNGSSLKLHCLGLHYWLADLALQNYCSAAFWRHWDLARENYFPI